MLLQSDPSAGSLGPLRAKYPGMRRIQASLVLAILLTACFGDPAGPGVLSVSVEGGVDTVWVGAPGEALPTAIRLHITDDAGRTLPAAHLEWEALGRNAQVLSASAQSDGTGLATASWQLGTDAAEEQQLRVTVRASRAENQIVIRARAVPYVVSQVRIALDTPAVVRLGDTLPVRVDAIDPYGNAFPAPDVALSVSDSTVVGLSASGLIGGRRGQSFVRVASHSATAVFPLRVTQYVAAIVPVIDILQFSALGAELPVAYVVHDDRGRVVADTTVAIEVADPAIALVVGGNVRAVAPGITSLRLSLGPASATMLAGVQQRVGSLRLIRDTIRIDALMDTTTIVPLAHDSLGSPIANPALAYDVSDRNVARFAAARTLEALQPGAAVVTVRDSVTGISTSAPLVVTQVVTAVAVTPAEIVFDAIADSIGLGATARDRLGSVVPGTSFEYAVSDTAVVAIDSLSQLRAVGPGQASVSARDPVTGIVGTTQVRVDQIATGLTVAVMFDNPIITLPAGAPLPLSCLAVDRNGYPIVRETAFVTSMKGTVTGGVCSDATVRRSGYDTLVFAMGAAQARVPVIVATAPDSVGVIMVAQPLPDVERIRFRGEDLNHPSILALRPLVEEILATYGNPATNLGRARALRDWIARTAVHPHPPLHPDGSTSNMTVLPPGKTWADVNALIYAPSRDSLITTNNQYWWNVGYDGYAMLDRLLGTLDPATGVRADDGMMVRVASARYQIRDLQTYRYPFCTFQTIMLNALWAAAGLHGMLASTLAHDPAVVFIPELGRWVYEDPTFNEEYVLDGTGDPLSPERLLELSSTGRASRFGAVKGVHPDFDEEIYIAGHSYITEHPNGMVIMGSQLNSRVVGIGGWSTRLVQIDVPRLAEEPGFNNPNSYVPVSAGEAFPMLAPTLQELTAEDSVFVVHLSSTFPNHQRFERRLVGQNWESIGDVDVLPVGAARVEYRSVDVLGSASGSAVLDVWAPRTQAFVQSAPLGSLRVQALYWVSP